MTPALFRRACGCACALVLVWGAPSDAAKSDGASPVKITGVYFDGMLMGMPEPDSAIRLMNTDTRRAASVGGFVLVEPRGEQRDKKASASGLDQGNSRVDDERDPERRGGRGTGVGGGGDDGERRLRLPEGASIPPGGEIWIAASGSGFKQVFGVNPAFEAKDSAPNIDDVTGNFPLLAVDHGAVALLDGNGDAIDSVVYETTALPYFAEGAFSTLAWKGDPVRLKKTSFYGSSGQVLARDRDERGAPLVDTNTAADWDSGFSRKVLGEEPTHRIELAGQSRFVSTPLKNVRAKVLATSAPDNNFAALVEALGSAKKSIKVRIYEMTNPKIVEELIKAQRRGVQVTIYLEGSPVGGIADQERWLVDRAAKAGAQVWFLAVPKGSKVKPRYRFDHSKYVILDDERVIIGTENYGRTGVPVFNTYGNRGWMVHVDNAEFTKQLLAVWNADFRPNVMPDILSIDASPTDSYGLPYRNADFHPDESLQRGLYEAPAKPVLVDEKMDLELVLSPDTSLNENSAIIGLMKRAKKTLYIEQNSIRRRWGKKAESSNPNEEDRDDAENAPNLPLQAIVAAARRGVAVRVLLDSTWYNVQGDEDRDNDDTVAWLNDLAIKENLDMSAKVINLDTTHLEKIHAKGLVADDHDVFVGSINWTENSFKGNREVGVVIGNNKVAGYYADLFRRDWSLSRIYGAKVETKGEIRAGCDRASKVMKPVGRGDDVVVVAEHRSRTVKDLVCAEVKLAIGQTAYLDRNVLGVPEASPGEALHIIGRDAVIVGRVAATNVSDRRVQLRFADEARPPFTAVIFKKTEAAFQKKGIAPSTAFQGHELRLRGKVTAYKGPEIVIDDPSQVEIVR